MKAVTHTEVYRPYAGTLRCGPFGFLVLAGAGIRAALKKKLALLLLYAPSLIGTIGFSFAIYLRYSALTPAKEAATGMRRRMAVTMAEQLLAARELVVNYNKNIWPFALLAVAWYGAGLLSEDRRVGAHQLYFSRPVSRLGYIGGKLLTVFFFGALALLVPVLVISLVAAFSSPDWIFLKEDWPDIVHAVQFAVLVIFLLSLFALVFSSLATRRVYAMAAMFGLFMLTTGFAAGLHDIYRDERWLLLSLPGQLHVVRDWIFDRGGRDHPDLALAWAAIGATCALSCAILWWRSRKLEVVA